MPRYVNLYFNKPIDIRRATSLITREFDYGDVLLRKVGSDAFGFFATVEVTDKSISDNALKLIGDSSYNIVDVLTLKNYQEDNDSDEKPVVEEIDKSLPKISPNKIEENQKELLEELERWITGEFSELSFPAYLKKDLMRDPKFSQVEKVNVFKLMALMSMICDKLMYQDEGISNSTFLRISKWMSRIVE